MGIIFFKFIRQIIGEIYFKVVKIGDDYRIYINEDNDDYWHVPWYCATEIDYKDIPKEYLI